MNELKAGCLQIYSKNAESMFLKLGSLSRNFKQKLYFTVPTFWAEMAELGVCQYTTLHRRHVLPLTHA